MKSSVEHSVEHTGSDWFRTSSSTSSVTGSTTPLGVEPEPVSQVGEQKGPEPEPVQASIFPTRPALIAPALRPYQVASIDAVRTRFRAGDRSTLLLLPTGTGKTVVFAEIARRTVEKGNRVLVLAHRTELLEQAQRKLEAAGVPAAIEKAERHAGRAPVVVASVQTLKGKRLESWPADHFGLVIVDEAHHASALSYRNVLDRFATARVLGVTATGDRADGRGLGDVFDSVAYELKLRKAIRDGWLCPIRAQRVKVQAELDGVDTARGDLHAGQLADVMNQADVVDGVVGPLLELAGTRPTILFSVDVAHAFALTAALNEQRPGCAVAVSGDSHEERRRQAAEDLASGKVQFVCNAMLWVEGFDLPSVSCIALARPTKSRALYTQMVGRGTRLAEGKADLLVLDFCGNTSRHRLVTIADVLADRELRDDERATFDAKAEAGELDDAMDAVDDAIEEAEETAERDRRRAVVQWLAEEVHDLLDVVPANDDSAEPTEPATERQRALLEQFGVKAPDVISKDTASRILDAISQRRERGLCSYKQARWLRSQGFEPKSMTFERAKSIMDARLSRYAGGGR